MKILQIVQLDWNIDMDTCTVAFQIVDDELNCIIGTKSETYAKWDTAKTIDQTKAEIQKDLESRYL